VNAITVEAIIAVATFVVSVLVSAIVAGMKWQKLNDKVEGMAEDLKEIKGMFTMRLKD
jgi:hypothetical protein